MQWTGVRERGVEATLLTPENIQERPSGMSIKDKIVVINPPVVSGLPTEIAHLAVTYAL